MTAEIWYVSDAVRASCGIVLVPRTGQYDWFLWGWMGFM
jgi:hypothetical protein